MQERLQAAEREREVALVRATEERRRRKVQFALAASVVAFTTLAGYEGMKKQEAKIPPQGQVRLTEAVERLVQLYEAMDKKDDGAKWRKELDAIKAAQKKPEKHP